MRNYITDIAINVIHYLKTHRPFGSPVQKPVPNYENELALNALISRYPDQTRMWLEHQFNSPSAVNR